MATVFPLDFSDFLKLLEDEQVQYLVIGGYAVGYYGYPRATADLDVWIAVSPGNAARTLKALDRFGMRSPELGLDLLLDKGKVIRMGLPPMRLEIQTEISGVEFDECFARRERISLGNVTANLISLPDLKANKLAAGRNKDLDDLEHLP